MENFDIKITNSNNFSIISLIGQADMLVAEKLDKAFNDLLITPAANIIVDLRELNFICSLALSSLIRAHKKCCSNQGELVLAGMPDIIMKLLQTTQLDCFFKTCSSVDQASDKFSK